MKEYLFSYGTLQKEKVQLELFGRKLQGSPDTLKGHRVSTIEIKDESFPEERFQKIAVISTNKNDSIKGMVYEITEEELLLADRYEPDVYKRVTVVLASGKAAWIYVAVET